jgi:hypothetical protein
MVWRRVEPPGVWRTTRRLTGRRGCASGTSTPVDPCRFLCVCVVIGRRRARARAVHEVVVELVGELPPPEIQGLAGPKVRVTGPVPSVTPHVARAAVVAAPLRLGGGMRVKGRGSACGGQARRGRRMPGRCGSCPGARWPTATTAPVREAGRQGRSVPFPVTATAQRPLVGALERRDDRVRRHRPRRGASPRSRGDPQAGDPDAWPDGQRRLRHLARTARHRPHRYPNPRTVSMSPPASPSLRRR